MSASDNDSHVLPNQASSDDDKDDDSEDDDSEDDDSEDETLEPLVRLRDGENFEPVVVAEVVPDAVAGVAAAAPPVNARAHRGVANALHQPLHKTIKLLAGASVEVVEEGEDMVEGGGEQVQDDFVLGRGAVLSEGRTIAHKKLSTCSSQFVSIYPSLVLSGILLQIVIPVTIQS